MGTRKNGQAYNSYTCLNNQQMYYLYTKFNNDLTAVTVQYAIHFIIFQLIKSCCITINISVNRIYHWIYVQYNSES